MTSKCVDHLNFTGEVCPDCNLEVDAYGNTESQFDYCCFPDCGCDGERLCAAPSGASGDAVKYNVEGMYAMRDPRPRMKCLVFIHDQNKGKK